MEDKVSPEGATRVFSLLVKDTFGKAKAALLEERGSVLKGGEPKISPPTSSRPEPKSEEMPAEERDFFIPPPSSSEDEEKEEDKVISIARQPPRKMPAIR